MRRHAERNGALVGRNLGRAVDADARRAELAQRRDGYDARLAAELPALRQQVAEAERRFTAARDAFERAKHERSDALAALASACLSRDAAVAHIDRQLRELNTHSEGSPCST